MGSWDWKQWMQSGEVEVGVGDKLEETRYNKEAKREEAGR